MSCGQGKAWQRHTRCAPVVKHRARVIPRYGRYDTVLAGELVLFSRRLVERAPHTGSSFPPFRSNVSAAMFNRSSYTHRLLLFSLFYLFIFIPVALPSEEFETSVSLARLLLVSLGI